MNKLTQFFLVLFLFCLPVVSMAQEVKDIEYLSGAVPEVDGKVVFSKEFNIPGMSQDEIYERMLKWLNARLSKNKNTSRVVYYDKEKGDIAGVCKEWIVFSSSALSLDRTEVNCQIVVYCKPGKCVVEIEKIRYDYREKEHYTAEGWITDKMALNKDKTKLIRGLAKWRKKTVDFANDIFISAAAALGAQVEAPKVEPENETKKAIVTSSGPVVITQNQPVVVTPQVEAAPEKPQTVAPKASSELQEVPLSQIPADAAQTAPGSKIVIVIGSDPFNMLMMTANAGGSLGYMMNKPIVTCFLAPDQPYEQMEKADTYKVRFYPAGSTEPSLVVECKKMPAAPAQEGQPRMFVGEVIKAWAR